MQERLHSLNSPHPRLRSRFCAPVRALGHSPSRSSSYAKLKTFQKLELREAEESAPRWSRHVCFQLCNRRARSCLACILLVLSEGICLHTRIGTLSLSVFLPTVHTYLTCMHSLPHHVPIQDSRTFALAQCLFCKISCSNLQCAWNYGPRCKTSCSKPWPVA